jgi:mannosyltransferase OCH1-like enzyme
MDSLQREIPKVIHYCWFGRKPLPTLADRCIASWKRYCPGFEIKEWNEDNFDVNQIPYVKQAYEAGKYAFVSDFARFWILEQYGGIYMDTDVELIQPIDEILDRGAYIGCEEDAEFGISLNPGLGMAVPAHNKILKDLLTLYGTLSFLNEDGSFNQTTIVAYTTQMFRRFGLQDTPGIQQVDEFFIYPREYFCPQHYKTGKMTITSKTHSIHHYSASWYTPYEKMVVVISHLLGEKWTQRIVKIKKWLKRGFRL